jgi:DNA modification methylase
MKTTNLPLEKLIAYAGNPRRNDHAVEAVAAAIKRFGFRVPVLAKSDGTLIDGHLRIKAAKRLGMTEVPVVLCDDLSEAEIKALRISINRMAELAEWDEELLMAELEGLAAEGITMDDVGFDLDALEALGASVESEGNPKADAEPQIDKAEELRAKWGVEPGQLWELGDHRLLCGDSTKKQDVERIMSGEEAGAVVTDPPYGIGIDGQRESICKNPKHNRKAHAFMGWDSERPAKLLFDGLIDMAAPTVIFGGNYFADMLPASRGWIYWSKGQDGLTMSDGELAWTNTTKPLRCVTVNRAALQGSQHPTQKPVAVIIFAINYIEPKGGPIYEPFSGSGTTIIACEQLGRKCRAIEISPAYVAVALQRWADATGKTPRLVS